MHMMMYITVYPAKHGWVVVRNVITAVLIAEDSEPALCSWGLSSVKVGYPSHSQSE